MGKTVLTIFLGVLLAIPLIYWLELESKGAITLLVFLCTGVTGVIVALIKLFSKKKRQPDDDHANGP